MDQESAKSRKPEIWAVGSGKGGTGKSFLTSSLGTYLAAKGSRVILIDADLGGANLHTVLGIAKPKNTLTDFFEKKIPLSEVIVECGIPNLRLVSGLLSSVTSEYINHAQKLKFFRHIQALDADYILIDLGAGCNANTIDTFLLAAKKIVVTTPELTALENMYHFIKNVYFRKLKKVVAEHGLKDSAQKVLNNREAHAIKTFRDLMVCLEDLSPEIRKVLDEEMSGLLMHIVVNQTRSSYDVEMGLNIESVCMKFLGLSAVYAGHIDHDDFVARCINKKQHFLISYAFSNTAKEIGLLSEAIRDGRRINGGDIYADRRI